MGKRGTQWVSRVLASRYEIQASRYGIRECSGGHSSTKTCLDLGSSAAVFKARWRGAACAVKRLNLMMTGEDQRLFRAEVKLHAAGGQPHVTTTAKTPAS